MKSLPHLAFAALITLHLAGFATLPVAASIGQSVLALRMLYVLMATAGLSIALYLFRRPGAGLAVAATGVAVALAMWAWGAWQDRPRAAEGVRVAFTDFVLDVPSGASCFPSGGGRQIASLTLKRADGGCPALGEGVMVSLRPSREPQGVVGDLSLLRRAPAVATLPFDRLPTPNAEEAKALAQFDREAPVSLAPGGPPSPLHSCSGRFCKGVARHGSTLVEVSWMIEEGRTPAETMQQVARDLARWSRQP